jgi:HCOMODA/2-hydroxy-3-carboxy-muconic semialdehyde decarboxylase
MLPVCPIKLCAVAIARFLVQSMHFTSTLSCFLTSVVFSALVSGQSAIPDAVHGAAIDLLDASRASLPLLPNSKANLTSDILHFLDIVDALGHVSVRNPVNSSQFLMCAWTPALSSKLI